MKTQIHPRVAYFSMEFAIRASIPNYAGGLGVLAADYLFSLADKEFPAVGVTLMYHGNPAFKPEEFAEKLDKHIYVRLENREVRIEIWRYKIHGLKGNQIPLYLLSSDCNENEPWDRDICKFLYPSDQYTRLCQEAILGIGGIRALRVVEFEPEFFHMNEGHSSLLTLELLREKNFVDNEVRAITRFTTHTPIAAGHDYFDYDLAGRVLGDMLPWHITTLAGEKALSMTHLALNLSGCSNSVSEKHNEVCMEIFDKWHFENITNGIYLDRWVAPATRELLDKYLTRWNEDYKILAKAPEKIPTRALKIAIQKNKKELINWLNAQPEHFIHEKIESDDLFSPEILTIGFARRVVPYKRTTLIFHDLARLRELGYKKIQIVFAGSFHGEENSYNLKVLQELKDYAKQLRGQIRICIIPEYNIDISRYLVSGCDIWLNNPIPPREASGTSGMKAALNGGLNFSIPDGWWIEGIKKEPLSGWTFGESNMSFVHHDDDADSLALYKILEKIIEIYYEDQIEWISRCKHAIALSGQFSASRAIDEYEEKMWH